MECGVNKNADGFFPQINGYDNSSIRSDKEIAEILGLKYEEYVNFIMENEGFLCFNNYYFKTKEDCQDFIKNFLEPRLGIQKEINNNSAPEENINMKQTKKRKIFIIEDF